MPVLTMDALVRLRREAAEALAVVTSAPEVAAPVAGGVTEPAGTGAPDDSGTNANYNEVLKMVEKLPCKLLKCVHT